MMLERKNQRLELDYKTFLPLLMVLTSEAVSSDSTQLYDGTFELVSHIQQPSQVCQIPSNIHLSSTKA